MDSGSENIRKELYKQAMTGKIELMRYISMCYALK